MDRADSLYISPLKKINGLDYMSGVTLFFASMLLLSSGAHAHHSTTHFSIEFTEMEGTLVDIRWRNPHIYFALEIVEEDGETRIWEMEAGTIYTIGRGGVTREMFTVGDHVRVAGNRSTVYDDKFWLTNVLLPEGREVLVVARGTPRWTDEIVGGRGQWTNVALSRNENTLIVDTSRVNFPFMTLGGIGQSEQMTMHERYTLSDDETQMHYKVTLRDPVMLTRPYVQTGIWIDLGEAIDEYDCLVRTEGETS